MAEEGSFENGAADGGEMVDPKADENVSVGMDSDWEEAEIGENLVWSSVSEVGNDKADLKEVGEVAERSCLAPGVTEADSFEDLL